MSNRVYDPYYPTPIRRPHSYIPPVSIGNWIGTFIISALPLINIIALFVWAFGSTTNPSKKNYARAILLLNLIVIVLSVVIVCLLIFVLQVDLAESIDKITTSI